MKTILIVGIGGTISSIATANGFKPGLTVDALLSYIPQVKEQYNLEVHQLMSIDSANMQPEDWVKIVEYLQEAINDTRIHGIVITHGTDTMALTAAAVGILLRDINKPIVFTGSQIPLSIFSSDAQRNLIDAIRVAGETDLAEAVIVFNSRVYRGTRTIKLREYDLSAFETVDHFPIAEISKSISIIDPFVKRRTNSRAWFDGPLDPNVALIKVFPGMKPEWLADLPMFGYAGVVIEGYGAGNLPINQRSLLEPISSLVKAGIPVVITTQCIYGRAEMDLYEGGVLVEQAGAISGGDMIPEVALIKLMWILGRTTDMAEIRKLMRRNLAGEIH